MSPWKCLCYMLSTPVVTLRWGRVGYPLTRGTVLPSGCYFRSHPFSASSREMWYFLPQCSATCCGALACAMLFGLRASKTVNLINFFITKLACIIYFIVMIFKTDTTPMGRNGRQQGKTGLIKTKSTQGKHKFCSSLPYIWNTQWNHPMALDISPPPGFPQQLTVLTSLTSYSSQGNADFIFSAPQIGLPEPP